MEEDIEIKELELFKTSAFVGNLSDSINFKELKKELYYYIEKYDSNGRKLSNLGGFQSNNLDYSKILNDSTFIQMPILLDKILLILKAIISDNNIIVDNAWININSKGDYNTKHVHPLSTLSGSVYIDIPVDDNRGSFTFHRERSHIDYNLNDSLKNIPDKTIFASTYAYSPKTGDILIFPSNIEHTVEPHFSQSNRISIAFNSVISR